MRRSPGLLVPYIAAVALVVAAAPLRGQVRVASPDGRTQVTVETREGRLTYSLARDGRALILPSLLGFEFRGAPALRDGLRITDTHPPVARRVVDPAVGRGGAGARPPQRAGRLGGGDRGPEPAVHAPGARLRRRRGLPLRVPRAARPRRVRDQRRADRVRPGGQRAGLVDPVQLAAEGPLRDAVLVRTGEPARQRADPAHDADGGRPHVPGDPRGEPGGLRPDVPARGRAPRAACSRRPWRRWPTASRSAAARRS